MQALTLSQIRGDDGECAGSVVTAAWRVGLQVATWRMRHRGQDVEQERRTDERWDKRPQTEAGGHWTSER